jgi:hypothetical protein
MKQFFNARLAARLIASCALFVIVAVPSASAQLRKAPSPEGVWEFKTAELYDSCTISGEMEIRREGDTTSKDFICTFRAVQACTRGNIRTIHTDQSCSASQAGSQINIISKVDKIVSTQPAELMKGMLQRYAPDNFKVSINPRGDQMEGMFESQGEAPVKFRRKQELTS